MHPRSPSIPSAPRSLAHPALSFSVANTAFGRLWAVDADLLIVRGDPSADILMAADKANHLAVVKNGTRIDTAAGAGAQPDVTRHRGPQMAAASLF